MGISASNKARSMASSAIIISAMTMGSVYSMASGRVSSRAALEKGVMKKMPIATYISTKPIARSPRTWSTWKRNQGKNRARPILRL